jgi:hypothetical protein
MVAALILYSVCGILFVLTVAGMIQHWQSTDPDDQAARRRRGEMMMTGIGLLLVAAFIAWIAGLIWK